MIYGPLVLCTLFMGDISVPLTLWISVCHYHKLVVIFQVVWDVDTGQLSAGQCQVLQHWKSKNQFNHSIDFNQSRWGWKSQRTSYFSWKTSTQRAHRQTAGSRVNCFWLIHDCDWFIRHSRRTRLVLLRFQVITQASPQTVLMSDTVNNALYTEEKEECSASVMSLLDIHS